MQVSRGKRQTTLPNAWWCAGIRRSARQQERDEAWALYPQSYRGTPKNEGFPTPSAPAASSDRVIGAQDHHHRLGSAWLAGIRRDAGRGVYAPLYTSLQRTGLVLLGALAFAAGMFLARRMVGADPNVARRCGAPRRSRPAHCHHDWRRVRGARRSVQRHGRPAVGILCQPEEKGRAAHTRTFRIAAAADGDVGRAARYLEFSQRTRSDISEHLGERCTSLRS